MQIKLTNQGFILVLIPLAVQVAFLVAFFCMLQQAEKMGDLRTEREAMMKLPAPERMEKMLERMKEHQKRMEAHLESTKGFYAGLSAEQKKVFDAFQPFAGRQGGGKDGSRSPGGQGKAGAQGAN